MGWKSWFRLITIGDVGFPKILELRVDIGVGRAVELSARSNRCCVYETSGVDEGLIC